MTKTFDEQQVLERQVREWTVELTRLAGQIAAAKGVSSAIVMITPRNEGYEDVVPELIAEDALNVHTYGWPEGFEVEVLNQAG
ncbi:hypothetical protein [Burkholderia pseudomallei]|uniref:hypothetical protein n=1 Tax=Burkholderia pseudomallei TaxID=28450 RepID=UPI00050F3F2A|nr:hypothetical protein [Burkholderia pseudomallei]KGC96303.1 hypothetical protein DP62_5867 [Burkholderia pseudomallei]KGW18132.1 hypothetical protein X980_6061 [Burkholderia pseudomallei MSHR4000]KGW98346.1 hypothetical protein Y048_6409 [Burkholderia pseudomallei MSHR456]MBF3523929.1 hypothetical protein [Burkholderia pseudomallei]MBF3538484.1 hypothetical protein [Burkholderia pseudomallei]